MKLFRPAMALAFLVLPTMAHAQSTSDYRFRDVPQSDEQLAAQGGNIASPTAAS